MKKIVVLGAGMVGRAMAMDMSDSCLVTSVDRDPVSLKFLQKNKIKTIQADLSSSENIGKAVKDADLVLTAVPGFMGYKTLEAVIKAGKNAVDISFFDEDAFGLDKLAKKKGVTIVVDCGIAPGMGNIIVGHWQKRMEIESFEYLAAGLPKERLWPFEYKAPFSPVDVIEIYTRPARHRENGRVVIKPAMSEPELINFPQIGTLEAFNTDGLRTLLKTTKIPNMKEKTLRYPGHIRLVQAFRDAGFFSQTPINLGGAQIKPLDFTGKIFFKNWKLEEKDEEFTIMRTTISGKEKGKNKKISYEVIDYTDPKTGFSSMARTTGFTATAVAHLVLSGKYKKPGINPPEYVGTEGNNLDFVLKYLRMRGVIYNITN